MRITIKALLLLITYIQQQQSKRTGLLITDCQYYYLIIAEFIYRREEKHTHTHPYSSTPFKNKNLMMI